MANAKIKPLVISSMFASFIILLAFTPLGFIQLGFIKATIVHIPVIIGSILLGPKIGIGLGTLFGFKSLISNTFAPVVSSFVFSPFIPVPGTTKGSLLALLICFLPRMLVGIIPWYVYRGILCISKNQALGLTLGGIAGSIANTLLVMNLIYFLFKDAYANIQGISLDEVYGIIGTITLVNGIPEALIAGILCLAICKILFKQKHCYSQPV